MIRPATVPLCALAFAACTDPISLTETVGPDGAYLELGDFALAIPPGALSEDIEIGFDIVADAGDLPALFGDDLGLNVRLVPHGTTFASPLVVSMPTLGLLPDGAVAQRLADEEADAWEGIGPLIRTGDFAHLAIDSFSYYGLSGAPGSCPCWDAATMLAFHTRGRSWLGGDASRKAYSHPAGAGLGSLTWTDGSGNPATAGVLHGGTIYDGTAALWLEQSTVGALIGGSCETVVFGAESAGDWFGSTVPGRVDLATNDDYRACASLVASSAPANGSVNNTVHLRFHGGSKLSVVKVVRQYRGVGLTEAKELVDAAPADVLTGVDAATAGAMLTELLALGADAVTVPDADPQLSNWLRVGFIATGLPAAGEVVVQLAGGQRAVTVSGESRVAWAIDPFVAGATYEVTGVEAPPGWNCVAAPDTGIVNADVLVTLSCNPLPEVCNAVDDDGDGTIDEGFDADGDGVTVCGADGIAGNADDDCDDADANHHPGAAELCNGVDDDCDGASVAGETTDSDGDGLMDDCDAHPADACPFYDLADVESLLVDGGTCFLDATGAAIPATLTSQGTITVFTAVFIEFGLGAWEVVGVASDGTDLFAPFGCFQPDATGYCTDNGRNPLQASSAATPAEYDMCRDLVFGACQ